MKIIKAILFPLFLLTVIQTQAQELRCRVSVQSNQIQDADKDLFNEMRQTVEEFMNSRVWTNASFEENEKIEMKINIQVTQKISTKNYVASLQIQSNRPCYNSTYTTSMFNHVDERMAFEYEENQSIEFNENSYISNLSSTLAYYAYLVLGIDFDSFSPQGGTLYFQKAQQVVSAASSQENSSEWDTKDKEGRYWLIENILNSSYSGYRSALYMYNRLGLDAMNEKPEDARKQIIKALEELQKVYRVRPGSMILTIFFYAKKDELIQIFSESQPAEKSRAVSLLKKMNPANSTDYDKILAN